MSAFENWTPQHFEEVFERMPQELRTPEALFEDFRKKFCIQLEQELLNSNKKDGYFMKKLKIALNKLTEDFVTINSWRELSDAINFAMESLKREGDNGERKNNATVLKKPHLALEKMGEPYASFLPVWDDFNLQELSKFAEYLADAQGIELWTVIKELDRVFSLHENNAIEQQLQIFQKLYVSTFPAMEKQCAIIDDFIAIIGLEGLWDDFVKKVQHYVDHLYDHLGVDWEKRVQLKNIPSVQVIVEHVSEDVRATIPENQPLETSMDHLTTIPLVSGTVTTPANGITHSSIVDVKKSKKWDKNRWVWKKVQLKIVIAPVESREQPTTVGDMAHFFQETIKKLVDHVEKLEWYMKNEAQIGQLEGKKEDLENEVTISIKKMSDLENQINVIEQQLSTISLQISQWNLTIMELGKLTRWRIEAGTQLQPLRSENHELQIHFLKRFEEIQQALQEIEVQLTSLRTSGNKETISQLASTHELLKTWKEALELAQLIEEAKTLLSQGN